METYDNDGLPISTRRSRPDEIWNGICKLKVYKLIIMKTEVKLMLELQNGTLTMEGKALEQSSENAGCCWD